MSSVDFDKIRFKKLEMTDDLTAFKCDTDDDSGTFVNICDLLSNVYKP